MPKTKKPVSSSDESSSDSGPEDRNPPKKAREESPAKSSKGSSSSKYQLKKSKDGDFKFELDRHRHIIVREFKSKVLIDIREFYLTNEGESRPGRKGISLTLQQWNKLKSVVDDVDAAIKQF